MGVPSKYIAFWNYVVQCGINIHLSMEGFYRLSTRLDDFTALNVSLAFTAVQIRKPTLTQHMSLVKVTSCDLDARLGQRYFSWPPVKTGSRIPSVT